MQVLGRNCILKGNDNNGNEVQSSILSLFGLGQLGREGGEREGEIERILPSTNKITQSRILIWVQLHYLYNVYLLDWMLVGNI